MKTIILLLLISSSLCAQTFTYRSYEIKVEFEGEEIITLNTPSAILFLDLDDRTLSVEHEVLRARYFLINAGEVVREGIDEDGDSFEIIKTRAVDGGRIRCVLLTTFWEDLPFAHFVIEYSDVKIAFLCRKI